jgi:hypothetical protein
LIELLIPFILMTLPFHDVSEILHANSENNPSNYKYK